MFCEAPRSGSAFGGCDHDAGVLFFVQFYRDFSHGITSGIHLDIPFSVLFHKVQDNRED